MSSRAILIAIFTVCIFSLFLTRIIGLDIWWHLGVGRYLLSTFSFPHYDVFSFTGAHWDNKEWLFGILVYLIERAGGLNLLSVAKSAIFTATFLLLLYLSHFRSKNLNISLGVVLLSALVLRIRIAFRPELFTYLFMAVLLISLQLYIEGRKRYLLFFPLLMLIWVNLHPLASIGLVILLIYISGQIICRLMPERAKERGWPTLSSRELGLLILILAASCLALSCNPISFKRFLSPLELLTTHSEYIASLTEAKPLPVLEFPLYAAYLILAVITLVIFFPSMHPADTITLAVFIPLALTMARNVPLLPLCTAPVIAVYLSNFFNSARLSQSGILKQYRRYFDTAIAAGLIGIIVWSAFAPAFGVGFREFPFPVGAVRYVKTSRPQKQMLNIYDWGGFLIWNLYPEYRVFIDGRGPDAYPPNIWRDYQTIELGREGWQGLLNRFGVNFLLISTGNKLHPLIKELHKAPEWRLAYWDFQSMLYLRDIPEHQKLIEDYRYNALDTENMLFRFFPPQFELQAMGELYRYLKENPGSPDARNLLAATLVMKGRIEEAINEYNLLISEKPDLPVAHYNLGVIYSRNRQPDRALKEFQETVKFKDDFAPAYNDIGMILYERGEIKKAEENFRKALKYKPDFDQAVNNLGIIYMRRQDYGHAAREFGRALELNPGNFQARKNLEAARQMMRQGQGREMRPGL